MPPDTHPNHGADGPGPKPPWLRVRLPGGPVHARLRDLLRSHNLHTVCEEALCPNLGACWKTGRATILILGDRCTRACGFCNVGRGQPAPRDPDEPARVAQAIRQTGLRDVVLTSVTRDDLPDGGASAWAETIRQVRQAVPGILLEVLVPDFRGESRALRAVLDAAPDVFGHNLETVPSLYPTARPQADYARSLRVLAAARARDLPTKSALMLGLGETQAEVEQVLRDARSAGCDIFFLGQYLRPSPRHLPVARYVPPAEFDAYRDIARALGFPVVVSAPLVRSSFYTEEQTAYVLSRQRKQGESHARPDH